MNEIKVYFSQYVLTELITQNSRIVGVINDYYLCCDCYLSTERCLYNHDTWLIVTFEDIKELPCLYISSTSNIIKKYEQFINWDNINHFQNNLIQH
jgi:hypothetical protein